MLTVALARPEYFCEWMLRRFPCLPVSHDIRFADRRAHRFFGEDGAAGGPLNDKRIVPLERCQFNWRVINITYPQEKPFEVGRHVEALKIDKRWLLLIGTKLYSHRIMPTTALSGPGPRKECSYIWQARWASRSGVHI